jgi:hypothetical protein
MTGSRYTPRLNRSARWAWPIARPLILPEFAMTIYLI